MSGTTLNTIKDTIGLLRLTAFATDTEEGRSQERHRHIAWTTATARICSTRLEIWSKPMSKAIHIIVWSWITGSTLVQFVGRSWNVSSSVVALEIKFWSKRLLQETIGLSP